MKYFDRYEALKSIYLDYIQEKKNVRSYNFEFSPVDNKLHADIPNLEAYKLAYGKLFGFLFAMQWSVDDKESNKDCIVVRRCSDNRIIKIIE